MKLSDTELLRAAQDLDAAYAGAAEFDAKMLAEWIEKKFERFTKRTEYPKLGYIIHQLNEAGIASIIHGSSFHAPLLYVERGKLDEAWAILTPALDELDDDDPSFTEYVNEKPDTDLYG
jgi:hypothetical protein